MKNLKIGIIGTGVGLRSIIPGFLRTGRAEIVALSGRSRERALELAGGLQIGAIVEDYRQVCESDADLIVVASPTEYHLEHALAALSTGKNVYLEKPVAGDSLGARVLRDKVHSSSQLCIVGHQLRVNPYIDATRHRLSDGSIGRPYQLEIRQAGGGFRDRNRTWTWEFDAKSLGGVRYAMGSHMIDLALYLLGGDVSTVFSRMDAVHAFRTPEGGAERRTTASVFFMAALAMGECSSVVSATAAAHRPFQFEYVISGEDGDLVFADEQGFMIRGGDRVPLLDPQAESEYRERPGSSIFSRTFTELADGITNCLLGHAAPDPRWADLASAVPVMEVLDACLESARLARSVALLPSTVGGDLV